MSRPSIEAFAVRVYYEDTDSTSRVYHASYLRFLERGRTEWLRRLGVSQHTIAGSSGILFAVRKLQIEFLAPGHMDDALCVETCISELRGASIEFRQRVLRGETELVVATVLIAAIRDGRPARIPDVLRRQFKAAM